MNYRLHRGGGRVKTAGLGTDLLYPREAEEYASAPSPEGAARLRQAMRTVQREPPHALSRAFFPSPKPTIKQNLQRTGLYRPFLKTDQGPAGTFLPFVTAEGAEMRSYRITRREGVAVPEVHLRELLDSDPAAREIADRLRDCFRHYQWDDCARALEEMGERAGFRTRGADVGRGLFFFCNASAADEPVTVPERICAQVEQHVNELMGRAEAKAARAKALYRSGTPLAEALCTTESQDAAPSVLYLQADVYVTLDGRIEIDQIQLPDVGIFLSELDSEGHTILPQVQRVVRALRAETTTLLGGLDAPVYLLTRPEVLHSLEDTLEHIEIQAFRKMAAEAGIELSVRTAADVPDLPAGSRVLLLNIDPRRPEWEPLLERSARGEVECSPDPFLKLLSPELTTQRRQRVHGEQLQRFLRAIRPGAQMGASSYHEMHRGIDRIYHHGKHGSDVLHVEVPGERTSVPTLRHSVHSFTSLYNTCQRNGFPELHIREVPIGRGNAVIHSDGGPHISAFRFYFTRA